jgi:CubicO group peptidase (beta-lactamase class C family)
MDRRTLLVGGLGTVAAFRLDARRSAAAFENPSDWLTRNLEAIRARHSAPALAAAIVMNGRIVAEGATGFRKQGADVRVKVTDAFQLGSITKPMTAALAGYSSRKECCAGI